MRYAFLLITLLCLLSPAADAAFRFKKLQPAGQQTQSHQVAHRAGAVFHFREAAYRHAFKRFLPAPYRNSNDGPGFGIASFAAALLTIACIALGSAGGWAFIVAAGVFAVFAIVLGALGLKRQMNGLAIAGMVIGCGAIIAGIIISIYVAAALAAW